MRQDSEAVSLEKAAVHSAEVGTAPTVESKRKAIVYVDPTASLVSCKGIDGLWQRGVRYPILAPGQSVDRGTAMRGRPQLSMVDALELQRQHRIIYWEVERNARGDPLLKADGSPRMAQHTKDVFEIVDIEED